MSALDLDALEAQALAGDLHITQQADLITRLRAAEARTAWQPMETAPRITDTPTPRYDHPGVVQVAWEGTPGMQLGWFDGVVWRSPRDRFGSCYTWEREPTHWHPRLTWPGALPAAPEASLGAQPTPQLDECPGEPEPGTPIARCSCPCCGAHLDVEHGDEPGQVAARLATELRVWACTQGAAHATVADYASAAHANARAKGWWKPFENERGEIRMDVDAMLARLMLITTEVAEAAEDVRVGALTTRFEENGKPVGLPTELADIVIRVMDMAEAMGVDLQFEMATKMRFNARRAHRHGGKLA